MSQPYAGANYGMHFPLHKGTEVLLTFVDGDPDRPIIQGSVPNPDTMSPVTGGNQTSSVIRTGGGNQVRIEDSAGGQQIHLSSPTQGSVISLGAPNEGNLFFKTDGDYVRKVHGPEKRLTNGKVYVKHGSSYKYECTGPAVITYKDNVNSHTVATTTEKFEGDKTSVTIGNTNETFTGTKISHNLAITEETFRGAKLSQSLAATSEIFVGAKQSACAAIEIVNNASLKLEKSATRILNAPSYLQKITSAHEVICGNFDIDAFSNVDLKSGGAAKITGTSITVDASGDVLIKGGSIKIQSSDITLDGPVTVSKTLHVKGAWVKHKDANISG